MSNEKISKIISGALVLALGILIAVFGGQTILDVYFGIIALVSAVVLLAVAIFGIVNKINIAVIKLISGSALLAIGIGLFTDYLTFSAIINFLILAILGGGAGLVIYGLFLLINKQIFIGIVNLSVGICAVALPILYISVSSFQSIFWIVIGVVVAIYGLSQIFRVVFGTKVKKAKTK